MKLDLSNAWSARLDVKALWGNAKTPYTKHVNVTVLAEDISQALRMVAEAYPGAAIWAVNHIGSGGATILIPDLETLQKSLGRT
jgi:hypothetical protein